MEESLAHSEDIFTWEKLVQLDMVPFMLNAMIVVSPMVRLTGIEELRAAVWPFLLKSWAETIFSVFFPVFLTETRERFEPKSR